jgi:hypothetical protein
MQVINGFVSADTGETEGVFLSTKCGELRTKKENRRFEIHNNFTKNIFCTLRINDDSERHNIAPGESVEVVIKPETKDLRITFGLPFEDTESSFTSAWGEGYGGNGNIIALFYMVNSTSVKGNSLF